LHLLENQEKVIQALAKGIWPKSIVEDVIKLDTERRAAQVELDGILAESNKLSKDIGEKMMKTVKIESRYLKRKTVLNKEKSKKLAEISDAIATELTDKLYSLPNLPADIVPMGKTPEENLNVFEAGAILFYMKALNHTGN
jgi:seryl-tRNA synthetase